MGHWCVAHPVAPARQERVLQCPHPPLPKPHVPGGPGTRGTSAWNGEVGSAALVKQCFWGFGWVWGLFVFVWVCLVLFVWRFCAPPPRSAWFFTGWKKLAGHKISGEACTAVLQKMCVTDKNWYRRLVLVCRTARIPFPVQVCFVLRTDSDVLRGSSFGCITFATRMAEAP